MAFKRNTGLDTFTENAERQYPSIHSQRVLNLSRIKKYLILVNKRRCRGQKSTQYE